MKTLKDASDSLLQLKGCIEDSIEELERKDYSEEDILLDIINELADTTKVIIERVKTIRA